MSTKFRLWWGPLEPLPARQATEGLVLERLEKRAAQVHPVEGRTGRCLRRARRTQVGLQWSTLDRRAYRAISSHAHRHGPVRCAWGVVGHARHRCRSRHRHRCRCEQAREVGAGQCTTCFGLPLGWTLSAPAPWLGRATVIRPGPSASMQALGAGAPTHQSSPLLPWCSRSTRRDTCAAETPCARCVSAFLVRDTGPRVARRVRTPPESFLPPGCWRVHGSFQMRLQLARSVLAERVGHGSRARRFARTSSPGSQRSCPDVIFSSR